MRSHRTIFLFTSLALTLSSLAHAVEPASGHAEIRINHKDAIVYKHPTYVFRSWTTDYKELPARVLATPHPFTVRPGEKVTIYIEDRNPFLYSYVWTSAEGIATQNATAAAVFTKGLLTLIQNLEPASGSSDLTPYDPYGIRTARGAQFVLASLHQDFELDDDFPIESPGSSKEILERAAGRINALQIGGDRTFGEQVMDFRVDDIMERAIEAVRSKNVPTPENPRIREILKEAGIPNTRSFLQDFKALAAKLYLFGEQTEKLISEVESGNGRAAKEVVNGWQLERNIPDLGKRYDLMRSAMDALVSEVNAEKNTEELSEEIATKIRRADFIKRKLARLPGILNEAEAQQLPALCSEWSKLTGGSRAACLADPTKLVGKTTIQSEELEHEDTGDVELIDLPERLVLTGRRFEKGEIRALADELDRARAANRVSNRISADPFYISAQFLLTQEDETRTTLSEMEQFATTMALVDTAMPLAEITYDGTLIKGGKLTITRVKGLPIGLQKLFRRGEQVEAVYDLAFKPYSAVQLEAGVATVYSFVKQHDFELTPEGSNFRIIDTENEYSGVELGAMLTIVPARWADSDFYGLFQVGVKPSENLGFFAGGGIKFSNWFSFGIGAAFEQVERLKAGVDPDGDGLIPSRDALKTEKHFEPGFYIHLTASKEIGKKN